MKTSAVSSRAWCAALIGLFFAPLASQGGLLDFLLGTNDLETVTVTDFTPMGNMLRQPTADHPLYYAAISAGYHDFGAFKGGEKPVPRKLIDETMVKILAKQGYLPAAPGKPADVVLAWRWGTMNAEIFEDGSGVTFRRVNDRQLLRFLGGDKLGLISKTRDPFPELTLSPGLFALSGTAQALIDASKDDLYVAMISAYAVSLRDAKHAQLLWNTRISAPSRGFWLPEALPAMLAIASPYVGRETSKPIWIRASEKFRPDIKLGDLRTVEYLESTPAKVIAVGPSS